jgi:hypothetical protein
MTNEEMRALLREILPFIGWDGEGATQAADKAREALSRLDEEQALIDEEAEQDMLDYLEREKLYL